MDWALLILITFFAASVQSATGFGFGLIAVSAFLILLNSAAAIQLVIIITLATSCIHWFKLKHDVPANLLKWLSLGCLAGFPLGVFIYLELNLDILKICIAVLIILISVQNAWHLYQQTFQQNSNTTQSPKTKFNNKALVGVGIASGAMASSLAMPGPAVMLYLSRTTLNKDQIRGTILTFFIFSYGGALLLQAGLIGISLETWTTAGLLIPPALIGVGAGQLISHKINQHIFKALVLAILMLTGLFMLFNL
ncbi:hypothetical protein A9Q77_06015 [Marinomonas sp. 42_23_T18]|nr:hypothetical protein A9Q77_06015 [Marinomonas sp. 42_23_T18]